MFFSNSISTLSDVFFDSQTEQTVDASDLLENESGSEDADSLDEEEKEHVQYRANSSFSKKEKSMVYFYSSFRWENYHPATPTEPPEIAV